MLESERRALENCMLELDNELARAIEVEETAKRLLVANARKIDHETAVSIVEAHVR